VIRVPEQSIDAGLLTIVMNAVGAISTYILHFPAPVRRSGGRGCNGRRPRGMRKLELRVVLRGVTIIEPEHAVEALTVLDRA
jgi:hypothetical protein